MAVAAFALLATCSEFEDGCVEGGAEAVTAGVGVTAGGGVAGVCAFAGMTTVLSATRMLPRRMLDLIGLRMNEKGLLACSQGNGVVFSNARKVPAHLDAGGPRNLPEPIN